MHGCETWLLTWREEHRLKVFEKRVLRRLFGLKRDKVTGEWRILHNKEHNDLYSSPNIIWVIKLRRMRWAGYVACMGGGREKVHTEFWCGSLKERYHLEDQGIDGRIILKWSFRKWDGVMDWIDLAQDRDRWQALVSMVMSLQVPQNVGNFLTSREPVSFSRRTLLHGVSK